MSGDAVITIVGMAVATYATRAGGLWLMSRFTPSPPVDAALRALPGTLLAALIAPLALTAARSKPSRRAWSCWPCYAPAT